MVQQSLFEVKSPCKIDWLSWTCPALHTSETITKGEVLDVLGVVIEKWQPFLPELPLTPHIRRFPYEGSLTTADKGITLFYGRKLRHYLIEMSGRSCLKTSLAGRMPDLLATIQTRATRIDIAVDLETDTCPIEFAKHRDCDRFSSHSMIVSETGTTYYVGSRKSHRYARVYRYNPPHPRSHLLRVEMVFRKADAKGVVGEIRETSLEKVAARAGAIYGWGHADWGLVAKSKLKRWQPEQGQASRVRWFYTQVAPALRDMLANELLTETQVIEELQLLGVKSQPTDAYRWAEQEKPSEIPPPKCYDPD